MWFSPADTTTRHRLCTVSCNRHKHQYYITILCSVDIVAVYNGYSLLSSKVTQSGIKWQNNAYKHSKYGKKTLPKKQINTHTHTHTSFSISSCLYLCLSLGPKHHTTHTQHIHIPCPFLAGLCQTFPEAHAPGQIVFEG